MPATLRAAPTTSLTAYVNERSTSSLSGRPVIPDLDTAIVVAGICATRWATAWLVVLVSAAAITSMPVTVLAGGLCDDGGGTLPSISGPPANAGWQGPQGPVVLHVGERSSASRGYGTGPLVLRPPRAGRALAPTRPIAAAIPSSGAFAQHQIIYAPGVGPHTAGLPPVGTVAGAPALTLMQPEIVYAPGAGPRAATPRFGNAVADTMLGAPVVVRAAGDVGIAGVRLSSEDCDALARVAYAEAGNQGPEGLAAVVYTVLNRVASGRFQNTIHAVIDARYQFEPVTKAGGWRNLPPLSPDVQAQFELLLSGILSGRIPDPTRGALYFQNREVTAARAAAGLVPLSLVDFGGQLPIAQLGDHRFYGGLASRTAVPKASASP